MLEGSKIIKNSSGVSFIRLVVRHKVDLKHVEQTLSMPRIRYNYVIAGDVNRISFRHKAFNSMLITVSVILLGSTLK